MSISNSMSSNDESKNSEIGRIMGGVFDRHSSASPVAVTPESNNDVPCTIRPSLELPHSLLFPELSDEVGNDPGERFKLTYRPQAIIANTAYREGVPRESGRITPPNIQLISPVLFQKTRPRGGGILDAAGLREQFHFDPDEVRPSRFTTTRKPLKAKPQQQRAQSPPVPFLFECGGKDAATEKRSIRHVVSMNTRDDVDMSPLHMVHPHDEECSLLRKDDTPPSRTHEAAAPTTLFRSWPPTATSGSGDETPTTRPVTKKPSMIVDYGIPLYEQESPGTPKDFVSSPLARQGYALDNAATATSCVVAPKTISSCGVNPESEIEAFPETTTLQLHESTTREVEIGGETPGDPSEEVARRRKPTSCHFITPTITRLFKFFYSVLLLAFSAWLVIGVVLTEKARLAKDPHPIATFSATWFLLIWLATMEGGQGCLIGLQRVDKKNYARTHPMALRCTTLAHKGDNMERFIVGRQFMVFILVFLTNMFKVMNVPDDEVLDVFLSSGQFWSAVAIILTTITAGQLSAQVHAATCMLDFVNSRAMLFTTYVALLIENTGILHSAYLVQFVFSKIAGKPIETKEKRNATQKAIFRTKIFMSLVLLSCALAVTLTAMFQSKTTQWKWIPGPVSIVLFFSLMFFVGMFEALQIALFEVIHLPDEYFRNDPVAKTNCDLAFNGKNLQSILIGRQICVTTGVFAIARMTTPTLEADDETIFGSSHALLQFFNTGLLGAFITTIVASLSWRIVAASFPLAFLNNPMMKHCIDLCLLLENSGICSSSWIFGLFHKAIAGLRGDEEYLGRSSFKSSVASPQSDCNLLDKLV